MGETRYRARLGGGAAMYVFFVTQRRTVVEYAVVLMARENGRLHTVRVYDNAHGINDMHRYNREGEKQPAETCHQGSAAEAMRSAREAIKAGYDEMIRSWRQ